MAATFANINLKPANINRVVFLSAEIPNVIVKIETAYIWSCVYVT